MEWMDLRVGWGIDHLTVAKKQSVGEWVSQWVFIVSDLEIAITSPCFASLFLSVSQSTWLGLGEEVNSEAAASGDSVYKCLPNPTHMFTFKLALWALISSNKFKSTILHTHPKFLLSISVFEDHLVGTLILALSIINLQVLLFRRHMQD